MRIALSTAALGLVSVVYTTSYNYQDQRERLLEKGGRLGASPPTSSLNSDASNSHERTNVWTQLKTEHRIDATHRRPCCNLSGIGASIDDDEGLGTLTQCALGQKCEPMIGGATCTGAGAGVCVIIAAARVQRKLQIQYIDNYCGFYEEQGYTCDCSRWIYNKGIFNCKASYGNATILGVPLSGTEYIKYYLEKPGAFLEIHLRSCYYMMGGNESLKGLESMCINEYSTLEDVGITHFPNDTACAMTVNSMACNSCTMASCDDKNTDIATTDSFDCSNVIPNLVADNICDNTVWDHPVTAKYPSNATSIAVSNRAGWSLSSLLLTSSLAISLSAAGLN